VDLAAGGERLLDRGEAANLLTAWGLRVKRQTLAKWHSIGADAPPVVYFGRRPLYRASDLHRWAKARLRVERGGSVATAA
jgi:hypothetical protein